MGACRRLRHRTDPRDPALLAWAPNLESRCRARIPDSTMLDWQNPCNHTPASGSSTQVQLLSMNPQRSRTVGTGVEGELEFLIAAAGLRSSRRGSGSTRKIVLNPEAQPTD
ncbi:hypothetical protein R1flu_025903 [Riccia fluitans]|uniref:Uncharacterized protein n=1 Tax=Riccia fluitans TaxID=41844 RepID=A0ABD1XZ30_9MARC